MNNPRHTSGSWLQIGNRVYKDNPIPTRIIAETFAFLSEEREANARLIAAAPELLSAAKAVDNVTLMIDRGLATVADLCRAMKQLQAAIAKAEGKS